METKRDVMPRLMIDGRAVEVPKGTKVIDAAERLGVMIPRFCYHEALGSVGACRLCGVMFTDGPVKGLQMSCMTDAQDGMVVSTTHKDAVDFRRQIIEWLMVNHPHDCPVCDEGGQCLLQDETVSGGHSLRRFPMTKRTYQNQNLGPFIAHEMNRCIHCYRCSRFYQQYAGYRDFGTLQSASRVYFGRFKEGRLESPFSGNLLDLCPTGVYTDIPSRFKVRYWDLERAASLCIHCSLGCNTTTGAHLRTVLRIEGRFNNDVNGHFLCDMGRYGYDYADRPDRPREAMVHGTRVASEDAVTEAASRLNALVSKWGGKAVACIGSARSSMETLGTVARLSESLGWEAPAFFLDPMKARNSASAVASLDPDLALSMREIERADCIVVVGADLLNEAPMAALAVRQAARNGASVTVLDPRPVSLPMEFRHIPAAPWELDACLNFLGGMEPEDADALSPEIREGLAEASDKIARSLRPTVICGTHIVRESTPARAAAFARSLTGKDRVGLFTILPGADGFGAAALGGRRSFADLLNGIELGEINALVAVESDPLGRFPNRERVQKALEGLDLFVVVDHLPTASAGAAHIVLPASDHFETRGHFINQEGRLQVAEPVHDGGTPLMGAHPPHVFQKRIPGTDHRPAWAWLTAVAGEMERELPQGTAETWFREYFDTAETGARVVLKTQGGDESSESASVEKPGVGELELIFSEQIFASPELAAWSGNLETVAEEPELFMHPDSLLALEEEPGERIAIRLGEEVFDFKLTLSFRTARGVMVAPLHRGVARRTGKDGGPLFVPMDRMGKQ